MTRTSFKQGIERIFKKSNPGVQMEWLTVRKVKFPTGVEEFIGKFYATAPGFKNKVMIARGAGDYLMVN